MAVISAGARVAYGQPCTYETCSLRAENGRLIRGRTEVLVGRSLTGMPRLSALIAPDDSARAYASTFDRTYPRSKWLALASGLVGGLALGIALDRVDAPERGFVIGLGITTATLGAGAWYFDHQANRALSRALWWHNAHLAEQSAIPPSSRHNNTLHPAGAPVGTVPIPAPWR